MWYELAKIVLSQIILFKIEDMGEASKIKMQLENYLDMSAEYNENFKNALSPLEQKLCKYLNRFVIRGKRGNKVPVLLLTQEMKECVDCLMKHRVLVAVLENSIYLLQFQTVKTH